MVVFPLLSATIKTMKNSSTKSENYNKRDSARQQGDYETMFDTDCRKKVQLGYIVPKIEMVDTDYVFDNVLFILTGPNSIGKVFIPTPDCKKSEQEQIKDILLCEDIVPFFEINIFNGSKHKSKFYITPNVLGVEVVPYGIWVEVNF